MLPKPLRVLWGDLSADEAKKFGLLASVIAFILGNYWMTRVMKNGVLKTFVGIQYLPNAKIVSLIGMIFIVAGYSKLVDLFEKQKLFYVLCGIYSATFLALGLAIAHPSAFSLSETSFFYSWFAWIPGKLVGWLAYVIFESSSLLILLFWAFVTSVTKPESAKKGYPLIASCIQIGTIFSTSFVAVLSKKLGLARLTAFASVPVVVAALLLSFYVKSFPQEKGAVREKKKKTGFIAGLLLIVTKPYVLGILVVSTFYEVVATILEFQMNILADAVYPVPAAFTSFIAQYGLGVNLLAFIFALLGTSFFMRKYGLRFCLMMYPTIVGVAVIGLFLFGKFEVTNVQLMWAFFAAMIAIKGCSYALNNPTKEVMYIPTSKDVRFKAKGWIESFGGRSAKGAGSYINTFFKESLSDLFSFGSIISLGLVGAWLVVASALGTKYNSLQKSNEIIE